MDYSTTAYHPYAEVYRRPLASPFPQGVALGTTGVPTRSAAARLLDIEHDFPGKFERRAEINRLKSKRRLESLDYGMLPYNSWATYLKPSTPARHYYSPQYTLDDPSSYPIVISRYPSRPLRMVQLAPLSFRCLPMPEQNADALTLEMEADDDRYKSQLDARRIQSSVWQSEATDRAIRLCKDRNRIRNQLRRIENARLVGPIFSRLGGPDQLGTRQKVLINYHKGANSEAAHHENAADVGKPKTEVKDVESHETPIHLPAKKHEEIVKEAEVHQADESQRSQQSTFSVEEQRREEAEPLPAETEPPQQIIPRHEEEQEREKEKEKKPKKEHKYETAKEKRRREQQEKKMAEQKEEKIAEPESPKIQKSLEPLSLKIKEQTNEKAAVEPASPGVTESFVLPTPKAKKHIEPASPKIKEEIIELTSPKVQEQDFEPMSPKIKGTTEPKSPVFQPESPKIFEETKPLSLKIKEQTSELTENVLASPKIEERRTPLQSPIVNQEKPTLAAEAEVETATAKEVAPVLEPEPEPEPEPEITKEKEPELIDVYESTDNLNQVSSPLVRDEPPHFDSQKSVEEETPKFESQKSVEETPIFESQKSVDDEPRQFESQISVDEAPRQLESQKSVEAEPPQIESQKSVEEVTETLSSDEPQHEQTAEHVDVERQTSVTSPELPADASEAAEDQEPQSPTVLRRLISNVSTRDGDACDPDEWDADDAVEVELPSERKGIILSASDNAIPDREDHYEAEEDTETPAVTTEEPSTEEGTDTVVWAKGNNVESFRLSLEQAEELTDFSASTNENAEAGSALTGDNAEETLSANGRPLSVDAESLAADDEQILDEALETTYSMHDRNLEPRVEEPDEETYKYDENVEYRSKSISIEEDE